MSSDRIVVIGTSCSGKTTLARRISQQLGIPHIELDTIHWLPNWQEMPNDEFKTKIDKITEQKRWVLDGNYGKVREITWSKADTIIWLNYTFLFTFWRALKRTIKRTITKEELFSGNYETFRQSFMSKDSILLWVFQTHSRRKKEYPILLKKNEYAHLNIIEIKKSRNVDNLITKII